MCKTMQIIVDRECNQAELNRSKAIALRLWEHGEHDLDKIADITELTPEQVREALSNLQPAS